jgi:hypothetical protein
MEYNLLEVVRAETTRHQPTVNHNLASSARGSHRETAMGTLIQLFRLVLIPAGMAMFMIAAQMSAGLTLRTGEMSIVISSR